MSNDVDLSVVDIVAKYGDVVAVDGVSFEVTRGQFVALLGPSGCGKTTTLRCVAGLEQLSAGRIDVAGRTVASEKVNVPVHRRDINMVFQSYAVWPHLSVYENVAYGLKVKKLSKSEVRSRVDAVLTMVGLEQFADRYGTELSGGQQQRVAVARAVVTEPRVLLFDEPLSNLDAALRVRMRTELLDLQRKLGRTAIYVTHDQDEAMAMADLIILMNKGRIEQAGDARSLYERPMSRFVAGFVGRMNDWPGKVVSVRPGEIAVQLDDGRLCVAGGSAAEVAEGQQVVAVTRPESLTMSRAGDGDGGGSGGADGGGGTNRWPASLRRVTYLGSVSECLLECAGRTVEVTGPPNLPFTAGDEVVLSARPESLWLVPAS